MPLADPTVSAIDVTFRFNGHTAISSSSFQIPARGLTTLIGPNGSGKSTLLNGIAGLMKPSVGRVVVHPIDGRERRIAYVLQTTKVNEALPVTVREVVTMGRYPTAGSYRRLNSTDRQMVETAMDRMGIIDLAKRHLSELSGGQRQRVFVAQGLAQDHDMLLLDEPLTGLDIISARAIDEVIHDEVRLGCTVVITTHDLAEAAAADHVLLLAGRVVASGPPTEVLTAANLAIAYGTSLVHGEGKSLMIDDPIHRPVDERHAHRDRTAEGSR